MDKPECCGNLSQMLWLFGPNYPCGGDAKSCKRVVQFGQQMYCGYAPAKCDVHQIVRDQAGCAWCKHYTAKLHSTRCAECLSAETRINHEWTVDTPDFIRERGHR